MLVRLVVWGLRRYLGGPARSWVLASLVVVGARLIRSVTGRRQLVETIPLSPGQVFVIEHRRETHRQQLRAEHPPRRRLRGALKAVVLAPFR